MRSQSEPWNDIVDDEDNVIGRWWLKKDGWMSVRSPSGATKSARPTLGSQVALARSMLEEPWASE